MIEPTSPLLVIVGETASGKSALAMELAEKYTGEIIAADSRTVYKDMDIGTAKPSELEREIIPHHLIDVVLPNEAFSAADFKRLAQEAINDIQHRNKLPIIVGGTGLYVDALLYDFQFRTKVNPEFRNQYEQMTIEQLQAEIRSRQLPMPTNDKNPRHLIGVLETDGQKPKKRKLRASTLVLGLSVPRDELKQRILLRVNEMVENGFEDEVKRLQKQYGEVEALQAPGYKAFKQYLDGSISLDNAKTLFIKNDLALAKRQRTWFKRNNSIQWLSKPEDAFPLVKTFLNKNT